MARTPEYFFGKTIIITGAASDIGAATALIFAREGANIVLADINKEKADEVAAAVKKLGAGALAIELYVTDRAAVDRMVKSAVRKFGVIDILFNSAGAAGRRAPFLEIDQALWEQTFALNFTGVFNCMQAVLLYMLEEEAGVIVNVASQSHKRGGPGASIHYAAAKGAVVTMTMGVAREFAGQGIRALSISPGSIDTPFQAAAETPPEFVETVRAYVPMGRFGLPEEIGEMVLFMCSDACEFMTADTVYINGGGGWR